MSDFNNYENDPDFEYDGELVQNLIIENKEIYKTDNTDRIIVTTVEKRKKDLDIVRAYYQGKRVYSKRVDSERPIYEESMRLVRVIINEITWGERE